MGKPDTKTTSNKVATSTPAIRQQNQALPFEMVSYDQFIANVEKEKQSSAKRKERLQILALQSMGLAFNGNDNFSPLQIFAESLTTAEQDCLRIWAERYSPAVRRANKEKKLVYRKSGKEENHRYDFDGMMSVNFLDVDAVKETLDKILGADSYQERILKMVKEIDAVIEGKKEHVKIQEDNIPLVTNLRNLLVEIGRYDMKAAMTLAEKVEEEIELEAETVDDTAQAA